MLSIDFCPLPSAKGEIVTVCQYNDLLLLYHTYGEQITNAPSCRPAGRKTLPLYPRFYLSADIISYRRLMENIVYK